MRIGLISVDGHKFPNIALGKLARWHKEQGDIVEWADPMFGSYDRVYASKIFNFSPDITDIYDCEVIKGGTGYDVHSKLPEEVDCLQPDYSMFPNIDKRTAYGFLTRGCPNKCPWCVVPVKEGKTKPYMDVEEVAIEGRNKLVLMDNNILAIDYGLEQIEKIIKLGLRVDFNQAMDARLVTDDIAKMLAQVKWIDYVRFGCDTTAQIAHCERAIELMRKHGFTGRFFLYCIINDNFEESFNRINYWHDKGDWRVLPFAQPYINPFAERLSPPPNGRKTLRGGSEGMHISKTASGVITKLGKGSGAESISQWQKDLAHRVNKRQIYHKTDFRNFEPRKGFKCNEYFE